MSYDSWKTTNPADEELGPRPEPEHQRISREAEQIRRRHATVMGHCPDCNADLYGPDARCYRCNPETDINF